MPDQGWSGEIAVERNATIIPPTTNGFRQAAGVLNSDGEHCDQGATWRNGQALTHAPPVPEATPDQLPGRWMWAGLLFKHFGHFLVESSARLWALDQIDGTLDGIIYVPKRKGQGTHLRGYQQQYLEAFGIDIPIKVLSGPTRVDELIIPGQGFGLGPIAAGTPAMRAAFHKRLGQNIAPEGPDKLFVSRAALGLGSGGIFGEDSFADYLRAEGYEVFYPEQHDISTQIARYKAAQKIIITDGSAAHFYAHLGLKNRQIAYLLRRSYWTESIITQIESFCQTKPLILDTIRREWAPKPEHHKAYRGVSFAQHDFARLQQVLLAHGFVQDAAPWAEISNDTIVKTLHALGLSDICALSE
ncbi:glycosyltransferase 61 family protein [Roseovarius sp. 2305UL8-3]|uniref:glycosyltransferase 61 family protein n=1 Tax=Roseovarius conchicola TaxID=3121636 RepID=UPI0035274FF2